jgi:hypothetical protein
MSVVRLAYPNERLLDTKREATVTRRLRFCRTEFAGIRPGIGGSNNDRFAWPDHVQTADIGWLDGT